MKSSARQRQSPTFLLLAVLAFGCGGAPAPAASPEIEAAPPPAAPAPPEKPASEPAAAEADAADEPPAGVEAAPKEDPFAARDLRFIQSPDGLRVEIMGVKFVPQAETIKTPSGIGVKVTLTATSGEARTLLAPEHGPMAFAGVVKRKGKEPEPFGDERKGDGELVIQPGKPLTISREWPGKNKTALSNNDKVELDIGLWGLGKARDDGRPVKQFLRVEARVEAWKGHARIKPPPSITGP